MTSARHSRYRFDERLERCIERARERMKRLGNRISPELPEIPDQGASEEALARLENDLGVKLPTEYRNFLECSRYLILDSGFEIWGLDHNGTSPGSPVMPFPDDQEERYLQFANYWAYADGDGLMFDLADTAHPVIAYLHEHGPLYEWFAPSFSLALWRMIDEVERLDEESADSESAQPPRLYSWLRRILGGRG